MDWPTATLRIVQECKGMGNAIAFMMILYGIAAIVRAARGK